MRFKRPPNKHHWGTTYDKKVWIGRGMELLVLDPIKVRKLHSYLSQWLIWYELSQPTEGN